MVIAPDNSKRTRPYLFLFYEKWGKTVLHHSPVMLLRLIKPQLLLQQSSQTEPIDIVIQAHGQLK